MLHQIGVGALGPVFRTYEPTRDRLVAVKVFRLDVTPEQAQSLAAELAVAVDAGLFHPSIVEPVGSGVQGTVAYRAEEYVAAESLDVAMRHYAPAALETALPFITQLAGAIDFARAAGVGHGALHPRDIFVTPDEARATGFGVVDALDRMELRAPVRRPYTAPERIAGSRWSTPADVFSLAAIAFELLTARRPSGTGDQIGSLAGALVGEHDEHAEGIRAVLARAMDDDPQERYPTALAFAAALEGAVRGETVSGAVARISAVAPVSGQTTERRQPESEPPPRPAGLTLARPAMPPLNEDEAAAMEGSFADESAVLESAAHEPVAEESLRTKSTANEFLPNESIENEFIQNEFIQNDAESSTYEATEDESAEVETVQPESIDVPPIDDVAAERDEDEAHWVLSQEEAAEANRAETAEVEERELFDDEAVEAASDRLLLDAAELALTDSPPAAEFADEAAGVAAASEPPLEAETQDIIPVVPDNRTKQERPMLLDDLRRPPSAPDENSEYPPVIPERPRSGLVSAVVLAIASLLVGLAGGYAIWGRDQHAQQTAAGTANEGGAASAAPQPQGTASTAERPSSAFTDQPVATPGRSSQPPATPPNVPADTATDAAATTPRVPSVAPRAGRITVRSSPARAGVTVNGRWRGRTPISLDRMPFGNYSVRIVLPGYSVERQEFRLSQDAASKTVNVQLEPQAARSAQTPGRAAPNQGRPPAGSGRAAANERRSSTTSAAPRETPGPTSYTGSIYVDSRPRGARVLLDGKPIGATPLRIPEVSIGSHVIRLELPGHQPWTNSTRVTAGSEERVTGSLDPIR